jgi:hypothetical protein|tara:strand:- start:208 stop:492 length:285 start_codon:yes stop_codon:yes gene_type:complete
MKIGDQVRYIGNTMDYLRSGIGDDPVAKLIKGNTYLVESVDPQFVEIKSNFYIIKLIGVDGEFNSLCFEKAVGCIRQAKPLDYKESYDQIPKRY